VSEENRNRVAFDPTQLWKQWYEAGTKMWSDVIGGGRGSYVDPFGLYRQWFSGLEELQKRMFGSASGSPPPAVGAGTLPAVGASSLASIVNPDAAQNPAAAANPVADAATGQAVEAQNLWKQWFDAASESWQKAAALGNEAVELTPRWVAMLDQMRHNFFSAEGFPTDPLQFAARWYNATSGPLSDFFGDLIERETILDASSDFMQSYASFYKVFRRDSEEYLKALSMPVRSDITRVAGLVVALEDKVDRIEEAFEDFEYSQAEQSDTAGPLEAVEERISGLESTLERIEGGNADGATAESVSRLENRLDDVQAKIDRLLAALENTISPNGTQAAPQAEAAPQESAPQGEEIRATAAARRKAQELGVELTEVEGTGANGQVTVDDVRRQNAREEGES
jgi:2-oxoacid dehydrogenase-like protein with E3 subunit-binding domain